MEWSGLDSFDHRILLCDATTHECEYMADVQSGNKYVNDKSKFPSRTRFDVSPGHADIYFTAHNFRLLDVLRAKASELGVPQVRLAMAWVMTHPAVTTVLIGARTESQIDNALEAKAMGQDPDLRAEMSSWTEPRY